LPREFVDKVRGIFTAQRASTTAAHSFSPSAHAQRTTTTAHVAEAALWRELAENDFMPDSTRAHVLAAPARPTQRPPSTPPPRRCPRCYGHHSSAGVCRGRPVPGVTPGANQSPSMPSSLDATHPSAPCAYHSSFRGQARHTNSECSRSSSGSPSKRPRNSPSPGGRYQADHRGQVRGSAMVAEAWPGRPAPSEPSPGDAVWQPTPQGQVGSGWASDDQGDLDWSDSSSRV
jgi:hypothetical protein